MDKMGREMGGSRQTNHVAEEPAAPGRWGQPPCAAGRPLDNMGVFVYCYG